jgi:hypothetical protein
LGWAGSNLPVTGVNLQREGAGTKVKKGSRQ